MKRAKKKELANAPVDEELERIREALAEFEWLPKPAPAPPAPDPPKHSDRKFPLIASIAIENKLEPGRLVTEDEFWQIVAHQPVDLTYKPRKKNRRTMKGKMK